MTIWHQRLVLHDIRIISSAPCSNRNLLSTSPTIGIFGIGKASFLTYMRSTTRFILARQLVCRPLYAHFFVCGMWFMVHCTLSSSAALGFIVHCMSSTCVALRLWSILQFIRGRHFVCGILNAFLLSQRLVNGPLHACAALRLWTSARFLLVQRLVHLVCGPLLAFFLSGTWFVVARI